jgi:hypothetical protein
MSLFCTVESLTLCRIERLSILIRCKFVCFNSVKDSPDHSTNVALVKCVVADLFGRRSLDLPPHNADVVTLKESTVVSKTPLTSMVTANLVIFFSHVYDYSTYEYVYKTVLQRDFCYSRS